MSKNDLKVLGLQGVSLGAATKNVLEILKPNELNTCDNATTEIKPFDDEALIAQFCRRALVNQITVYKNIILFRPRDYRFSNESLENQTDLTREGTVSLHIIKGHAFFEVKFGKETIVVAACLLNSETRKAMKLLIDGEVDTKHEKFGRVENQFETNMAVSDAQKHLVWMTLDLKPLQTALVGIEGQREKDPTNNLRDLASSHCPICSRKHGGRLP